MAGKKGLTIIVVLSNDASIIQIHMDPAIMIVIRKLFIEMHAIHLENGLTVN